MCRIDNDAVLMRDVYPITMLVGYQFCMRWANAHVFYVKKRSPLAKRILDITRTMPLNHPHFLDTIVDKVLISGTKCPDNTELARLPKRVIFFTRAVDEGGQDQAYQKNSGLACFQIAGRADS